MTSEGRKNMKIIIEPGDMEEPELSLIHISEPTRH